MELRAGLSTFLTVAYILVLNPQILSAAGRRERLAHSSAVLPPYPKSDKVWLPYASNTGLPVKETTTSTALAIAVASLLSGTFSNLPFVLAPSGLNGTSIRSFGGDACTLLG